jgi:hypothetical protein
MLGASSSMVATIYPSSFYETRCKILLHTLQKVRNKVVPTLELHVYLPVSFLDLVAPSHEAVVSNDGLESENGDNYDQKDHHNGAHPNLRNSASYRG